jgi:hypothetical protein
MKRIPNPSSRIGEPFSSNASATFAMARLRESQTPKQTSVIPEILIIMCRREDSMFRTLAVSSFLEDVDARQKAPSRPVHPSATRLDSLDRFKKVQSDTHRYR